MKISELMNMVTLALVKRLPSMRSEPVKSKRKRGPNWEAPDKPQWNGYMTGRTDKTTGVPVPGMRPTWRLKYAGDRSKYMPHQGKRECARRIRQGLA